MDDRAHGDSTSKVRCPPEALRASDLMGVRTILKIGEMMLIASACVQGCSLGFSYTLMSARYMCVLFAYMLIGRSIHWAASQCAMWPCPFVYIYYYI